MLEFVEKYLSNGVCFAQLRGLPVGMSYTIKEHAGGRCECMSRTDGAASTRYYSFRNYGEAVDHGIRWGKRKLREARRAA